MKTENGKLRVASKVNLFGLLQRAEAASGLKQLATGKGNITKRLSELKEQGLLSTTKQIPEGYIETDNG